MVSYAKFNFLSKNIQLKPIHNFPFSDPTLKTSILSVFFMESAAILNCKKTRQDGNKKFTKTANFTKQKLKDILPGSDRRSRAHLQHPDVRKPLKSACRSERVKQRELRTQFSINNHDLPVDEKIETYPLRHSALYRPW